MGEALEDHASAPTKTKASTTKREKPRKRKQQLFKNIREQMEFYFSDANLRKDRFMTELVQENDEGCKYRLGTSRFRCNVKFAALASSHFRGLKGEIATLVSPILLNPLS